MPIEGSLAFAVVVTSATGNAALISFAVYLLAVFALAWLSGWKRSHGAAPSEGFVGEYFLGSRNLGVWAFALTFAATSASGGSFVGFPSLIYSHGWVLALWIAGYMMVPLLAMALLGKRLNEFARRAHAITVPDVIEQRFASPLAGVVATLLIVFFLFYFLLAQFKAGSEILATLLTGVPAFDWAVNETSQLLAGLEFFAGTRPDYVLCLFVFSVAVIGYVMYGGFRAVVWTDVMQGIIMFLGVVLLLVFAIRFTGGMGAATRQLAERTPPRFGTANLVRRTTLSGANQSAETGGEPDVVPRGTWIAATDGGLVRTTQRLTFPVDADRVDAADVLVLTCDADRANVDAAEIDTSLSAEISQLNPVAFGQGRPGVYLRPPGPDQKALQGFLPLTAAFSFFVFWPFGAAGQPGNMVRLMAFRDTRTLRLSIVTVTVYFSFVYFALVAIFCCARVLIPGMEAQSDRIMPTMALYSTQRAGIPWLAGLLLAAPFAAVMSSVDSFLLMIASSLVRDIYQRFIHRTASEATLKRATYSGTIAAGVAATYGALRPPEYLQSIIVDASGFLSASFFAPVGIALFWRHMTAGGAVAGMLGGCLTHAVFSLRLKDVHPALGWLGQLEFLNPLIWALLVSVASIVIVSRLSKPLQPELVNRFFPPRS